MRRTTIGSFAAAGAMIAAAAGLAATAGAEPLPVPHDFTGGFATVLTDPGGEPAGANDFTCESTAEHPRPVVLVHGSFLNKQSAWTTYAPLLANEGYCVFALTYGADADAPWPLSQIGGRAPVAESAAEIGEFIDEVLEATGAEQVDIVGHSQGTFVPNYYVKFLGGQDTVANYVSLAPLWRGVDASASAPVPGVPMDLFAEQCPACMEMSSDSETVLKMNSGGSPYVPGVRYTNIMTRYDETVTPYTAGYVEGPEAVNIVVQDTCELDESKHGALAASPVAAGHVLNALDPDNPREVPCVPVDASTGAPR